MLITGWCFLTLVIFNNFGDVYFEGLCVVGCWKSRTHFTNITFLLLSFWMYNYTITHFLSQRFCGRQFFFLIPLIPSITPLSELNYFCFLLICCEPLFFFFQPLVHYEHHNKNYIPNGPLLVLERCNFFFSLSDNCSSEVHALEKFYATTF